MEKEENLNQENASKESLEEINKPEDQTEKVEKSSSTEEKKEISPEEKISELEDKLARTFAEMENQRRRFEKEKKEAFEYGGFIFAKEALNLIANIERSKQTLENEETLKDSEALKKTLEHLKIINQDLISIFSKNNINPYIDVVVNALPPTKSGCILNIRLNFSFLI